jgi:hemerythrin-like domain-containing protein
VIDPLQELAHDHRELNELLIAIHGALSRVSQRESTLDDELHEIRDGVEAFRDALLVHFAREQEALFPFVVAHLPAVRDQADAIIVEHESVANSLTELVKEMSSLDTDKLASWLPLLSRSEQLYSAHSQSELKFLEEVSKALADDPKATAKLRALLAE